MRITGVITQTAAVIGQFINDTDNNDVNSVFAVCDGNVSEVIGEVK